MAVLSAVTLLEWDVVVFWCMVTASLIFLLVLLATVFFQEDQMSSKYHRQQTALQLLLGQKLLPIESSLGWQLAGVFNNLRAWTRCVAMPNQSSQTLHGCWATVDAEAEDILAAVQNITKQREWDPSIATISQSSPPRVLDDLDAENPVMMDVVCVTLTSQLQSEPVHPGILRSSLHHLLRLLPMSMTSWVMKTTNEVQEQKEIVMNRIWKVERDGSCWMFSKNEDSVQATHTPWCYFLIQPILETSGRSVFHIIWNPSTDQVTKDVSKCLATRLAALCQYIKLTQLKLPPLTSSTLQHVGDLLPLFTEEDEDEPIGTQDAVAEEPRQSRSSKARKQGWDRGTGEPPEGTARTNSRSKAKPGRKSLSPSGKVKRTVPSRGRRQRGRVPGVGGGGLAAGGGSFAGAGDGVGNTASSSSEDTGYSDWMSNKGSLERDGKAPGVVTSEPGVVTGLMDYMLCDEEPTSLKDGSDELYTLANQCTAELLKQSNQVAAINVNTSVVEQKTQTGGWFFHSVCKEVVIMQKNPVQGKYHCFLGKGVIRAPPEEVFKAVKNPRTRFIYDNMLKKMDIIKELNDKVQIVYAVHEVPQLLRKESRDFCLLQTSKTEGSSHIVAFTSANVAECPPSDTIPRSHVLPSGWIIEPRLDDRGSRLSMVTYIVQVSIGGKSVPASFVNFLSKRVPLSVAYLRLFIESENM
ncbi:uncharacterized protein LOC119740771 isoform X2 [Patiria miniata]|uniref:START domain-containing protein n=1 Tax=Patiria miniata TaxID=46514 RepID=A0A914B7G9_PATMI|nr:uncharacterized protein LOC119740771 isoform X2 [Patiria miniata]